MNNRLVAYRKMLGITQKQMADRIGKSLTTYNHKETGKVEFNQKEMIAITDVLKVDLPNITVDEIFYKNHISNLPI